VCSAEQYTKVFNRLEALPRGVDHLIIQLGDATPLVVVTSSGTEMFYAGIPIAYPRMVFLENMLSSKFNPLVTLGKSGTLGLKGFVNKFNADAELLDDLVLSSLFFHLRSELIVLYRMTIGRPNTTRFFFLRLLMTFGS
jgi:hypothetical protein